MAGKPLTEEMKGDFSKIGKGDKIKNLHINFMDIDKLTQIFQIQNSGRSLFHGTNRIPHFTKVTSSL